jgi:hypothetical protein
MDYKTFKGYIRKSGLGIKDFAAQVGMNHKSISNYSKRKAVPQYLALISLMMLELEHRNVNLEEIFAKLNQNDSKL